MEGGWKFKPEINSMTEPFIPVENVSPENPDGRGLEVDSTRTIEGSREQENRVRKKRRALVQFLRYLFVIDRPEYSKWIIQAIRSLKDTYKRSRE